MKVESDVDSVCFFVLEGDFHNNLSASLLLTYDSLIFLQQLLQLLPVPEVHKNRGDVGLVP